MKKGSDVRKALCYAALMEDNGVMCTIGGRNYIAKRRKDYDYTSDKKPVVFYEAISPKSRIEIDYNQFERQVGKHADQWLETSYVKSGDKYFEISATSGLKEIEVSDMIRNTAGYGVPNQLIKNEIEDNISHEQFMERQAKKEAMLQKKVDEAGMSSSKEVAEALEV